MKKKLVKPENKTAKFKKLILSNSPRPTPNENCNCSCTVINVCTPK